MSQNEADPPRRQRVRLNDPDPPPVRRRVRLYDPLVSGLPRRPRARPTVYHNALYERHLRQFAKRIIELSSRFDFAPSSRGWKYVLEGEGEITKGDFDVAQRIINECRKLGLLPLDSCSEDERRQADGLEKLDASVDDEVDRRWFSVRNAAGSYTPVSFWDDQEWYIEVAVEKIDLKNVFALVCARFRIPIQNVAGWSDLHSRANMMRRFKAHEAAGRKPVLLYCGDHDPGGLHISGWLRANMEEIAAAVEWHPDNLIIDRFGLNFDDIERLDLTWIDNLETGSGRSLADPKHPDHHKYCVQEYLARYGERKCEANALIIRPGDGRAMPQRDPAIPRCRRAATISGTAPPYREDLRKRLAARFDL